MIEFCGELGGDFARAFAKLIPALLHHFFAQAVELRLHFLFVPFRRLVDLFACAVANVARLAFQFPEVPADNFLRRFLEQLFDSAQIFSESRKRFRERIIRSAPYALLLQRQRSIEQ